MCRLFLFRPLCSNSSPSHCFLASRTPPFSRALSLVRPSKSRVLMARPISIQPNAAWVSNMPAAWGEPELRAYFETYGTIVRVDIPSNAAGGRKMFAYVHFSSAEECEAAIAGAHMSTVNGRALQVRHGLQRSPSRPHSRPPPPLVRAPPPRRRDDDGPPFRYRDEPPRPREFYDSPPRPRESPPRYREE
jgi:RNA recognition motif-containing protein